MTNGTEKFEKWCVDMAAYRVPKWDELPDIGLYMDQVITFLEKHLYQSPTREKVITPAMINNYVKLGLMPPPQRKRYSREHIAYLMMICTYKAMLPIGIIKEFIEKRRDKRPLADIYDSFCEVEQRTKVYAVENARSRLAEIRTRPSYMDDEQRAVEHLALELASFSNIGKQIAETLGMSGMADKN